MTKAKTGISILALGAGLLLAGCSSWPDSLDPGSWFERSDPNANVPGPQRTYPKLSTVPERPAPRDEEAEKKAEEQLRADRDAGRAAIPPAPGEGLIADRADARYTDEPLRREEPRSAAPPPPPPAAPAPAAAATAPPQEPAPTPPPAVKAEPAPPPPASQTPVATAPLPSAAPPQPPAPAPAPAVPSPRAAPPQQAALPPVAPPAPPPPTAVPAAPEIVAMAPVRSPGDPPASGGAAAPAAVPSASLTWNAPPPDIDLVRTSGPRGRETPVTYLRGNGGSSAAAFGGGGPAARVMFASGSAKLAPTDEARLRQVAEAYRRAGGTVAVIGHASASAADRTDVRRQIANFSVSMDRANAVARALQRYGVPGSAIAISAETDAVVLNDADGRRADVFLR